MPFMSGDHLVSHLLTHLGIIREPYSSLNACRIPLKFSNFMQTSGEKRTFSLTVSRWPPLLICCRFFSVCADLALFPIKLPNGSSLKSAVVIFFPRGKHPLLKWLEWHQQWHVHSPATQWVLTQPVEGWIHGSWPCGTGLWQATDGW